MQWLRLATGLVLFSSWMAQAQTGKKLNKTLEKAAEPSAASVLFPDWAPESFDWTIGPIAGVRARETVVNDTKVDVVSSEIGLGARIQGIPLAPGNPGITVQPYGTYTWGNRSEKLKSADLDETQTSGFQRSWYGVVGRFYYRAFRYSLDLGMGEVNHDKVFFTDIRAQRIQNDFGLMILSFLSAHYTLTSLNVKEAGASKPAIEEIDHWVHGRMGFSLFHFNLDVGPGMSRTKYRDLGTATSTYLKALTSLQIFWKLGASGSAKYITSTDEDLLLSDSLEQLPYEGLAQRRSLAILPDGSLEASAFFGLRDLFAGFGVGWQYYYLELKTTPKEISRNQGFALVYSAEI